MVMPNKVKIGLTCLLLFGAVAVDFANKLMSIGFDLFFIGLAIWVVWPVIKDNTKTEG